MNRTPPLLLLLSVLALMMPLVPPAGVARAQELFQGLEIAGLPTRSTDLAGFPDVSYTDRFTFEVSGAAATPAGDLYLCNGAFTTHLYQSTLNGPPVPLATLSVCASSVRV